MRKMKKSLFGYSPHEVDAYLTELGQHHQEMVHKRNQAFHDEVAQIEAALGRYRQEEQQSNEHFQAELSRQDEIVRAAQERAEAMKTMAQDKLLAYKDQLAEKKQLLQTVLERIEQLQELLTDVDKNRPIPVQRGDSDGRQTI